MNWLIDEFKINWVTYFSFFIAYDSVGSCVLLLIAYFEFAASLIDGPHFKKINKRCLISTSSIWFVVYPAVWSLFWNWTQFCVMLIHILVCIIIFGTHTLSLFLSFSHSLSVCVILFLALIQTIFLDLCWCLFVCFFCCVLCIVSYLSLAKTLNLCSCLLLCGIRIESIKLIELMYICVIIFFSFVIFFCSLS